MSDTKNTDTRKNPPVANETPEDIASSREIPEQEAIETRQAAVEIEKEKGFLDEVAGSIGEGAKMVGEKATELGDIIIDKMKKGLSQAYEAGAKVVDDLSQAAQGYTEKYKAESEIGKLRGEKDKLMTQLGQSVLNHHLAGGRFTESFFKKKEILDHFNQIEILDKNIVNAGKQLDKGKE